MEQTRGIIHGHEGKVHADEFHVLAESSVPVELDSVQK